jgi:biotin operon repressor
MNQRSTDTMERQIWDLLPNEAAVRELKAVPMSAQHIAEALPYAYQSIRKAINELGDLGNAIVRHSHR